MQILSSLSPLALEHEGGTAVAMGFFDGIHIGHRAVIDGAVAWAKAHGAAPAVFTFQLPADNKMKGKRLLSTEDKHALIASLGVEYYLCPQFEEIRAMTPEQFVYGIVQDCQAKALFCGENFTFGAKAAGTPDLLRRLCAPLGVEVVVVPMTQFEEKPVSSTRIRTALEGGDIPAANAMLGMPYAIRFAVQHGAGLGHTLGAHHQPDLSAGVPAAALRHLYHPHQDRGEVVPLGHRAGHPAHGERRYLQSDLRDLHPRFLRRPLRCRPGGGVPRLPQPQQKVRLAG